MIKTETYIPLFLILLTFFGGFWVGWLYHSSKEKPSIEPQDWIEGSLENVRIINTPNEKNILIDFPYDLSYNGVLGTGSMQPCISANSTSIYINPHKEGLSEEELNLQIGDVIVFNVSKEYLIIHRIVKIKKEGNITIYKTKGDHNLEADDYNVTYNMIKKVLVGIIY